ncbi:alpha/beta fold hydrolase [Lentzea sp. BCCO 10_0856]|uniref:Alpha/beta fold hydrolase n=1 Tax=Lentzea miocenica TaxID=3095431 RepID=A0ABU4SWS2_9PSEU|nr:alpha/beta fold hydrolase [Lentzea sp. BCCO 10_0856]MDX8030337.1 alpha/beta fold hydrolase [Lentzea sp. BCCO 10_0856]
MWRPVLIAVAVVVTIVAVVFAFQRKLVYFPSPGPLPSAEEVVPGGRDVRLVTADGLLLDGWHFELPDAPATVIVFPGNGGNRLGRVPLARELISRGLSVLLFDYRGYGGNPGKPTEEGLTFDARAALDLIDGPVIYFGESLGAAVAVELATYRAPLGLVLRSPFVSLAAVGSHHYPWLPVKMLLQDKYPLVERVSGVDVPTVVLLGTADSVVPPAQSREVATAARARLIEISGADHNDDVLLSGPQVVDAVLSVR